MAGHRGNRKAVLVKGMAALSLRDAEQKDVPLETPELHANEAWQWEMSTAKGKGIDSGADV
jgi:hypothetical protein